METAWKTTKYFSIFIVNITVYRDMQPAPFGFHLSTPVLFLIVGDANLMIKHYL